MRFFWFIFRKKPLAVSTTVERGPIYLRNNICTRIQESKTCGAHYENRTNPGTGHIIFPVNTVAEIGFSIKGFFYLLLKKGAGKKIDCEHNDGDVSGMSVEYYINNDHHHYRKPVPPKSLSDINRREIDDGKAYAGMSTEPVLPSLPGC